MKKENEMKKMNKGITTLLALMMATTMVLTACGQTAEEAGEEGNAGEEVSVEPAEKVEEPLAEEDLEGILTGIEDHYVLQDAKDVDYMHDVSYDETVEMSGNDSNSEKSENDVKKARIINNVTADNSDVDASIPGTYKVTYTVKVNRPAYEEYMEQKAKNKDEENSGDIAKEGSDDKETENAGAEDDERSTYDVSEEDLEEVSIEKNIEVVDEERAKELVEAGESIWADENRDYGEILEEEKKASEEQKITNDASDTKSETRDEDTVKKTDDNASKDTGTGSNSAKSSSNSSSSSSSKSTTCDHNWVATKHEATGHYEEVLVQAAYDEKVENGDAYVCNKCGYSTQSSSDIGLHCKPTTANAQARCDEKGTSYSVRTQYTTIHHDAVYESKWVQDSAAYTTYKCSKCGATK